MDIKEVSKEKSVILKKAAPFMGAIAQGVVGFLLARAIIFGGYAPFGIAYAAVSTPIGIAGVIVGYISILHKLNGLKYIAVCILAYTASYVFRGTKIIKNRWFLPLAAAVSTFVIGFVFVADAGFELRALSFYITEILLVAAFSYFYQFCYRGARETLRQSGIGLLAVTLVMSLCGADILSISIGKTLASALVMFAGYFYGTGYASAAGVAVSIAVSAASGDIYYSVIYGTAGLLAPIFRKKGEYIYTAAYLIASTTGMLWTVMRFVPSVVYESILSAAIFLPTVHFYGDKIKVYLKSAHKTSTEEVRRVRDIANMRLKSTAEAFRDLGNIFRRKSEDNNDNVATIFNAPIERVCKKCVLAGSCWEQEYITTRDALNSASRAMLSRGELEASDFPVHFSARCIRIGDFIHEANIALGKFLYRKQCANRVNESRELLKKQYNEVSSIISRMSSEIGLSYDECLEARIEELLEKEGVRAHSAVYRDHLKHLHIEIQGSGVHSLCNSEFAAELSKTVGTSLCEPEAVAISDGERITIREKEPYKVTLGAVINKKRGGDVSGDAGSYFKTEDGRLAIILADGMGTGREAAEASTTAIKLIERFVRAGIEPRLALSMINSALTLSGESDGNFTTIDFMQLDLYSGHADFYKLGSAPCYIKRDKNVRRISSSTLPAGVPSPEKVEAEHFTQNLKDGDCVVLITDGITENSDDTWLVDKIAEYEGKNARAFATEILACAATKYGAGDDMTVLVARVDKNE